MSIRVLLSTKEKKARAAAIVAKLTATKQRERKEFLHTSRTYATIADLRMELEYGLRKDAA